MLELYLQVFLFSRANITMEDKSGYIDILTADESEETIQSHIFPYDPGNHFQGCWIYFEDYFF